MKSPRLHLNLLRESERLSSSPVRIRVMLPVMAILACAGCLVWWATLATQLLVVRTQVSSLQDELAGKKSDHANILMQMAEAREKQAQLDQLQMYSAGRNAYGDVLARLAEVMPIRVQLTKIVIPEGTVFIGDSVFAGCWMLTDITLPDSLNAVNAYAFDNCTAL